MVVQRRMARRRRRVMAAKSARVRGTVPTKPGASSLVLGRWVAWRMSKGVTPSG
jgi:hypothetical protein